MKGKVLQNNPEPELRRVPFRFRIGYPRQMLSLSSERLTEEPLMFLSGLQVHRTVGVVLLIIFLLPEHVKQG